MKCPVSGQLAPWTIRPPRSFIHYRAKRVAKYTNPRLNFIQIILRSFIHNRTNYSSFFYPLPSLKIGGELSVANCPGGELSDIPCQTPSVYRRRRYSRKINTAFILSFCAPLANILWLILVREQGVNYSEVLKSYAMKKSQCYNERLYFEIACFNF